MIQKTKKKKSLIFYSAVFIVTPLFIGAILYYVFCEDVWFVRIIDELFGNINRPRIEVLSHPVLMFVRNYGFDFIWAFSMTNALLVILCNVSKSIAISFIITILAGIVYELLQLFRVVNGTFDIWDVVAEIVGSLLGIIIIKTGGLNE